MSIKDDAIELENGSNLRSFINHVAANIESLKSASEPVIVVGMLSGNIPESTTTYNDVTLTPYSIKSNFSTDIVKVENNVITIAPDVTSGILITTSVLEPTVPNTEVYQRLCYQNINDSEWNVYDASVKRKVFTDTSHQSISEIWLLTPTYPISKYKLQITASALTKRHNRQNMFALIGFTNSQKG